MVSRGYRTPAWGLPAGRNLKASAKATGVAPDGFCVVSDLLWREPELLDFTAAVQFGFDRCNAATKGPPTRHRGAGSKFPLAPLP